MRGLIATGRTGVAMALSAVCFYTLPAVCAAQDAARLDVTAEIDARMTEQQLVRYYMLSLGGYLDIGPANPELSGAWTGTEPIADPGWTAVTPYWETDRALLNIGLASTDGRPVAIDAISIEVSQSAPVRRPMLTLRELTGCIAHRPHVALVNPGWGPVEKATLSFAFKSPGEDAGQSSRRFDLPVPGFSDSGVIDFSGPIAELGADAQALEAARFMCSEAGMWDGTCTDELRDRREFGGLGPFLGLRENKVMTRIEGELRFSWRDPSGHLVQAEQPLHATISLALLGNEFFRTLPFQYWDPGADAERHIPVSFPSTARNVSLPVDYRGRRSVTRLTVPVQLTAPMTSVHVFRIAVRAADGSTKTSAPMRLNYIKPRTDLDMSAVEALRPARCLIDP